MVDKYSAEDLQNAGRLKQIRMVASLVNQSNKKALPIAIGTGLAIAAVFVVVGLVVGMLGFFIPIGVLLGLLAVVILFGRFATAAQYKAIEGQPGAAYAILQQMRGNWTVTGNVGNKIITNPNILPKNLDMVHRAVGRPGVVLVGEGEPRKVASLLAAEKKRTARIAFDVPIFEFQVGDEEGQVPVRKLQRKLTRLPRNLKPAAINDLNNRLKALQPSQRPPLPKGPLPRNARQPRPKTR